MRTATLRRLAVSALAAAVLVAGCGDDGGDEDDAAPSTEPAESAESTGSTGSTGSTASTDPAGSTEGTEGTEADDGGASTAPSGSDATTTTTSTEGDEPGATTAPDASGEGQEGTGAPDEEAPDVSWDLNAVQYRGQDGKRIAYLCPPDGEVSSGVWGTGTYTDDSSVCSAAVHAGLINPVEGGRVVIEVAPGEESYKGSEANGVTTDDYGSWLGSFTFPVG